MILVSLLALTAARCCADSATVTVPAAVSFFVTDVNFGVLSTPTTSTVSFADASLASGNSVRFSIKADASDFTRPVEQGGYIAASKVTWVTTGDVNGTGYAGVLSAASYTRVFQGNPDATSGSTEVGWTLATIGGSVRAGDHTLIATWKVESL